MRVNSLHDQGIARLSPQLSIEAVAPDGVIEAVRVTRAQGFAAGVQWHPEFDYKTDRLSEAIFAAFGQAVRARMAGLPLPHALRIAAESCSRSAAE